ncbi:iron complex transport system permease protein [Bacillus pakistanensis]|uniref:Iron complex transport system permease protein n=1 Tax=Rossellomorea pakistanensis TaxID=992288 RepID=A0ABS2N7I1_9BACI|nr:iron chelate uptake ABC transporter family permease subunit [Bacillus pakistanensis]MBM7583812.1 iron complex transport system permease protein [Bacillus pakistanensis]
MSNKLRMIILGAIALSLMATYFFIDIGSNWDYVLPRRGEKLVAIIVTGASIALATVVFQTITHNRILTPNIIGLDSLYMLIQTILIFLFGSMSQTVMNKNLNFVITIVLMILFSLLLYKFLFKREDQNIYFLLLIGLIFGTLFGSLSTFMQVLIDPNEFQIIQDRMFASFNNIQSDLLLISLILIIIVFIYFTRYLKYLDVLSLGRDEAVNLGVDYHFIVKRLLIIVAVLISISTALVGPLTFLGLIVANVAYEFLKTYRHSYFIIGSMLISIIALIGGQLIVERVFSFTTTLSVIINFTGGVYFIYLLLKENKSW